MHWTFKLIDMCNLNNCMVEALHAVLILGHNALVSLETTFHPQLATVLVLVVLRVRLDVLVIPY